MSVTGGPVRVANPDLEVGPASARLAVAKPATEAFATGGAATARRRTSEFARQMTRRGRLRRAAHRMIWGGSEASAADSYHQTERGRPWSTGREILAEIVLPLLGLAVVIGIAAFWAKP